MKEIQEAIDRLDQLRIDITKVENDDKVERDAYEIQQLLFKAMDVVKKLTIPAVAKLLPTDECVEQWWAQGKDQQKGFWQEAPYRTNGDVVEEIKTALKYFIETWQR
jgi:hypothetical protein